MLTPWSRSAVTAASRTREANSARITVPATLRRLADVVEL
jgi:hypothetical protein